MIQNNQKRDNAHKNNKDIQRRKKPSEITKRSINQQLGDSQFVVFLGHHIAQSD